MHPINRIPYIPYFQQLTIYLSEASKSNLRVKSEASAVHYLLIRQKRISDY